MSFVDWIYPKVCAGCEKEGEYICDECRGKLNPPVSICPECNRPSIDGWVHARCQRRYGIDRLIVGLPYHGAVQKCLKNVKYKSSWEVINFLHEVWEQKAEFMIHDLRSMNINALVTAVPMWGMKERERGFNQAERLGKLIASEMGLPYLDVLERVRDTRAMWGLDHKQRIQNVVGAFSLNSQFSVLNFQKIKLVLLVDDVWTTGATMRMCAGVLIRGGAKKVWGIALSR